MFLGCSPCCNPCTGDWSVATDVIVEITANDYLLQRTRIYNTQSEFGTATQKESVAAKTSILDGTHFLTRIGSLGAFTRWSVEVQGQPSGCGAVTIVVDVYNNPSTAPTNLFYALQLLNVRLIGKAERQYSSGQLSCGNPQYYDIGTIGGCTSSSADCSQASNAVNDRSVVSQCINGQFTNPMPYAPLFGQPGFSIGSDWQLISSVTDADTTMDSVVVQSVDIVLP